MLVTKERVPVIVLRLCCAPPTIDADRKPGGRVGARSHSEAGSEHKLSSQGGIIKDARMESAG